MKLSLRMKFMLGLMAHTLVIYLAFGVALLAFNMHERRMHPDEVQEEREELFIIYGLMAAVLPLAVAGAWLITGQLLKPLQTMLRAADEIRAGRLDQRIETPVAGDELGQLARALNDAFDNYRRVLGRLDRFSLDAAHQLRNPLAAMRASAEVCLQQPRAREEYEEVLARVLEESARLSHTVDELLLLARLTRDNLQEVFAPVDLAALARELAEDLKPAFEARGVRLETRLPETRLLLRGSTRLLEQALANLLDNALRFTPAGGQVVLELQRKAPDRLVLSVADSGPGLAIAGQAAGDRPESTSDQARPKDGAGLGLLIVSNVADAHGGTVQATVSQWGGACFTLELPGMAEAPK
ncbi:MAG TPA: ATP-binding protein [Verrucomicrobiae bacterium]